LSIIKPIAQLLGYILDILFKGLNAIGIGNIAIAIIIFTLLVKMLMLPLQIKQQKMTKLQSVMNPEIKAIQEKYKGKSIPKASDFLLIIAILVSYVGIWISTGSPLSKRVLNLSGRVSISLGGLSDDITICFPKR
jgi:membrane protein insertase Oxa1/YidC/SpoIIIJ